MSAFENPENHINKDSILFDYIRNRISLMRDIGNEGRASFHPILTS